MTIGSHLTTFAGLPIRSWDDDTPLDDPAAVAWRVEDDEFEGPIEGFERAFEAMLDRAGPGGPTALVLGMWGTAYDEGPPLDLLTRNLFRLTNLRSLFIGEMTFEQCEISWINQGPLNPLLEAFGRLERLWVRGSVGLELAPLRHEGLRELVLQSGGLPAPVIAAVLGCDLPHLSHLELWLGVENYGGGATPGDLAPLLTGRAFPALTHLGLRNAENTDEIAAELAAAPVVARLRSLDLSLGTLGDAGAEALLAGQPLDHLDRLDLHHHFMSTALAQRLVDEFPGVRVDVSEQEAEREWGRYTSVSE